MVYAVLEDADGAIKFAERAMAADPEDPMLLYNVACTYSQLGRLDDALVALERAVDKGFGDKTWLEHDSDLEPLRAMPRYQSIVQTM